MKKVLRKSSLVGGVLILVVVSLGIVFAGDVVVKEGDVDVENLNVAENLTVDDYASIGHTGTADTILHVKGDHVANVGIVKVQGNTGQHAFLGLFAPTSRLAGYLYNYGGSARWQNAMQIDGSMRFYGYGYGGTVARFYNGYGHGEIKFPAVYSYTVGATNADLFVDNAGYIGLEPSSIQFKENIRDIENSSRIYDLRPVTYDEKNGTATNIMGLIAEEVEPIMPEIITYKQVPIKKRVFDEIIGKEVEQIDHYEITDEPLSISYSKLIPPMLKEIQNLKQENQMLKDELARLKEAVGIK